MQYLEVRSVHLCMQWFIVELYFFHLFGAEPLVDVGCHCMHRLFAASRPSHVDTFMSFSGFIGLYKGFLFGIFKDSLPAGVYAAVFVWFRETCALYFTLSAGLVFLVDVLGGVFPCCAVAFPRRLLQPASHLLLL